MKLIFYALLVANVLLLGNLVSLEDSVAVRVSSTLPVSDASTILLLSERSGVDERKIEVAEVLKNAVTVESQILEEAACLGLGPFEDILVAQDIAERLNASGLAVTLNALDNTTGEFDYRVVIPPLPSLQEGFRRLRELKSRDIDSYVVTQGEDAQGISLGVFSTEEAALSHQDFLGERGYDVLIKQIPRFSRAYWIQAARGNLDSGDLEFMADEFPEVSLSETACIN
jgi:hypothetical protein